MRWTGYRLPPQFRDEVDNVIQFAGKLVEEARFDGIFVLGTNACCSASKFDPSESK